MDVYFVEWLWGYSCIHTQVCVSNVSWIIATQKTDHTTYTRGIVFSNINWNTVPMISRGEDFQCVFNIMALTLNTQTSIFVPLLFCKAPTWKMHCRARALLNYIFISVSCCIVFLTDSQMKIVFLVSHTDIKVTFDLRNNQHK